MSIIMLLKAEKVMEVLTRSSLEFSIQGSLTFLFTSLNLHGDRLANVTLFKLSKQRCIGGGLRCLLPYRVHRRRLS